MSPVIEAAWIGAGAAVLGVGGTVIVAIAGFRSTRSATRQTIVHARETRVWDQRAAVYVDALRAIHQRREGRLRGPDAASARGRYVETDWYQLEATLQAFASERVFTAITASSAAHHSWVEAAEGLTADTDPPEVEEARKAAEVADVAVIDLIRAELQGR